jgi:predicted GIY-YIG superfamily endonuclease
MLDEASRLIIALLDVPANLTSQAPWQWRYHVYLLADPIDYLPRYIGCSTNLRRRYRQHLSERTNPAKFQWIAELRRRGLQPVLVLLETTDKAGSGAAERRWIEMGRALRWPLFNSERKKDR